MRSELLTGYAKALMNPRTGPLVGIPQFVPINTHRVRAKSVLTFALPQGCSRFAALFNPRRVIASDLHCGAIYFGPAATGVAGGGQLDASHSNVKNVEGIWQAWMTSNVQHSSSDFMRFLTDSAITNGDGIKGRCVAFSVRVHNTSAPNIRDGVFTALHEKHHKNAADFTLSEIQSLDEAKIQSCSTGAGVSLLYRPVQPFEVDDWQQSPYGYTDERHIVATDDQAVAGDETTIDTWPGFMRVDWDGSASTQSFMIEIDAICEYAGESLTTLSRPPHLGGGKKAEPKDLPAITSFLKKVEGS
jgi:hypothetical protein